VATPLTESATRNADKQGEHFILRLRKRRERRLLPFPSQDRGASAATDAIHVLDFEAN
jgi:hypothetical protein